MEQETKQTFTEQEKYPLLSKIDSPADLKALSEEELFPLLSEIRAFLVDHVTETGGHLASNLGVVELSVALHRIFDLPKDHIVWDVSHQCYVHKLLTGRRDRFPTLRQPGGLSGFSKREESEYDCFGAGHSSTALSAALGFAEADKILGKEAYTVAVIGDGAYTGGMVHEALNNCKRDLRLIIVLNENEMSISHNIGRFAQSLSKVRTREGYYSMKRHTAKILSHIPLVGTAIVNLIRNTKQLFKNALYGSNYFENLGLYYIGPIDGNDYEMVETALAEAKKMSENVVIHLKTQKGKGYPPAEADPSRYHGIPPKAAKKQEGHNFSCEMGALLDRYASPEEGLEGGEKICAITAAMGLATGLSNFALHYPDRYFDVGIAEEHALTFAAGLAAEGMRPVVPIYSTFLQRGYDNILHDIALQKLPVIICADRAGLNAGDGATHHGIFDVSFLSSIPGITIYTPITFETLALALREALSQNRPAAIRYPNAYESQTVKAHFYGEKAPETVGIRIDVSENTPADLLLVTHGRIAEEAIAAKKLLKEEGITLALLLAEKIKPYDALAEAVETLLPQGVRGILTLEEEIRAGGFGVSLADRLYRCKKTAELPIRILAPEEDFVVPKAGENVFEAARVDRNSIVKAAKELLAHETEI